VSGSEDETVWVWDVANGEVTTCLRRHEDYVQSVAFSPDGQQIVSGSDDKTVRVWDATTAENPARLRGHKNYVLTEAFSPGSQQIVSGSQDRTVRVWDASSGEELACLRGHESDVWSVAFSPDSQRIVSQSRDGMVRVWETASGREIAVFRGHIKFIGVPKVTFSPDSRWIISESWDDAVQVWDPVSGTELIRISTPRGDVKNVAFSPDGQRIVFGNNRLVRIWDLVNREEVACLHGHEGDVTSVAISPDGGWIASGSDDKTVRVWHAVSGQEIACHQVQDSYTSVKNVGFSPDGGRIIFESIAYRAEFSEHAWRRIVYAWDLATGQRVEVLDVHWEANFDMYSFAAGLPYIALQGWRETIIKSVTSGKDVAWFSLTDGHLAAAPSGRAWAGAAFRSSYLAVFTLEGEPASAEK
jgi:WD40 repeat protein